VLNTEVIDGENKSKKNCYLWFYTYGFASKSVSSAGCDAILVTLEGPSMMRE
jgi:hypothetical protein